MSEQQRTRFSNAMAWILRAMTALGAVFLLDIHATIKENHVLLQQHLREYAADKASIHARLSSAERDIDRLDGVILPRNLTTRTQ